MENWFSVDGIVHAHFIYNSKEYLFTIFAFELTCKKEKVEDIFVLRKIIVPCQIMETLM